MRMEHAVNETPSDARPRTVAERLMLWLLAGMAWLLAARATPWLYPDNPGAADFAAMVGGLLLALPVLLLAARDLYRGRVMMNGLVALAVLAAISQQDYHTAGLVSVFMLLSVILENRSAAGAADSIEALVRLSPKTALCIDEEQREKTVPVERLAVGDMIRIRPGDVVPADGVIRRGRSTLNEAAVTGESLPVDKQPGARVFAGAHNLTGVIEVEVDRVGTATTLGRVRELIMAAERSRLPVVRLIDAFVHYYIPVILMLSLIVWLLTNDLRRVIAMLVIACPCALVLAAPAAMVAALASAARHGVLLKRAADLETMARVNAFVFDKTGTLTHGEPRVARLAPVAGVKPAELLECAAAVEQHSPHPLARALRQLCAEAGVQPPAGADFHEEPGCGVTALVAGVRAVAGRAEWLRSVHGLRLPAPATEADERGLSVLWVARDGVCLGWIGFGDATREDAADCLKQLRGFGVARIAMVTGDRRAPADAVGAQIDCGEIEAQCLPQAKVEFVGRLRAAGYRVAVVGDGINDAPALAAGDVGIAMGAAGSEVAVHSAGIALMSSNLLRLPFLLGLARKTRLVVAQNIAAGALLILAGVVFAAMGLLHPVVAALLHNLGSLFVVLNSARLAAFNLDAFSSALAPAEQKDQLPAHAAGAQTLKEYS